MLGPCWDELWDVVKAYGLGYRWVYEWGNESVCVLGSSWLASSWELWLVCWLELYWDVALAHLWGGVLGGELALLLDDELVVGWELWLELASEAVLGTVLAMSLRLCTQLMSRGSNNLLIDHSIYTSQSPGRLEQLHY